MSAKLKNGARKVAVYLKNPRATAGAAHQAVVNAWSAAKQAVVRACSSDEPNEEGFGKVDNDGDQAALGVKALGVGGGLALVGAAAAASIE